MTDNYRDALVAAFSHFDSQRNRPEKRYMISVGQSFSATFTEDVVARTCVGRDEVAHILNDTEHRYRYSFKHSQSATHVRNRDVLRCGYKYCTLHRNELRQRQ